MSRGSSMIWLVVWLKVSSFTLLIGSILLLLELFLSLKIILHVLFHFFFLKLSLELMEEIYVLHDDRTDIFEFPHFLEEFWSRFFIRSSYINFDEFRVRLIRGFSNLILKSLSKNGTWRSLSSSLTKARILSLLSLWTLMYNYFLSFGK